MKAADQVAELLSGTDSACARANEQPDSAPWARLLLAMVPLVTLVPAMEVDRRFVDDYNPLERPSSMIVGERVSQAKSVQEPCTRSCKSQS